MRPAADFAQRLIAELTARGADQETPVLFLCRSGVRSLAAARALASAGWRRCYNVSEGFEGGLDAATHRRGALGGWRAERHAVDPDVERSARASLTLSQSNDLQKRLR